MNLGFAKPRFVTFSNFKIIFKLDFKLFYLVKMIIFTLILSLLIMLPTSVYAEHVFEDTEAFAQIPDIVQLSSEKFVITIDDDSYDMYYGYHASLDSIVSDEPQPKISFMSINQDRISLEISFDEVSSDNVFWVAMPDEVISAEQGYFQLFIDDAETQYDLTRYPGVYALGMIIPNGTQHIEIIGTYLIPEFSMMVLSILAISILFTVAMTRKNSINLKF